MNNKRRLNSERVFQSTSDEVTPKIDKKQEINCPVDNNIETAKLFDVML